MDEVAASAGRDDRMTEAERALVAIAGTVGISVPFGCKPRDVYMRVRRLANEHEAMRVRLSRMLDEADEARRVLSDVEVDDD